ncbi:C-type lectin [Aphelenchoides avenae]|nr:C-type lectin [Aphelenchus avenae]
MDPFDALNSDSNPIRRPAFEPVKPWTVREKYLLGISAVLCFAFVVTLIVCMRQQPCAQAVAPPCARGWSQHGGHCYKLLESKSFYEANHECRQDYGAELASVHSKNQSDFLGGLVANILDDNDAGAWIGLQRGTGTDSKWVWADGTPLDFENWSTDEDEYEVDESERSCVVIVNGNYDDETQWAIRRCRDEGETAICQKKL